METVQGGQQIEVTGLDYALLGGRSVMDAEFNQRETRKADREIKRGSTRLVSLPVFLRW